MKKFIASIALAAFVFSAPVALAHENKSSENGMHKGWAKIFARFERHDDDSKRKNESRFNIVGTVVSTTATSITVSSAKGHNVPVLVSGNATVAVNADTKITASDKTVIPLANLKVGDKVMIAGTIAGTVYTAAKIHVVEVTKAAGKITAKTATSVTITNSLTGVSKTVTTDADTKVSINGETKTVADIQVGDSGWVKFKNNAGTLVAKFFHLFR